MVEETKLDTVRVEQIDTIKLLGKEYKIVNFLTEEEYQQVVQKEFDLIKNNDNDGFKKLRREIISKSLGIPVVDIPNMQNRIVTKLYKELIIRNSDIPLD